MSTTLLISGYAWACLAFGHVGKHRTQPVGSCAGYPIRPPPKNTFEFL